MIRRVNIENFGSFYGFNWNPVFRNGEHIHEFERLNIIFGRNYSGKTTLSKVFRCFEVADLPSNYDDPRFELVSDGRTYSNQDIIHHDLDVRVYNKDFVEENLSFLSDSSEGEVKTFAILGRENKHIEELINLKEHELGNIDLETGLRYKLHVKKKEHADKKERHDQANSGLQEKLRRYANDVIKKDRNYGNTGYNINGIKTDIEILKHGILDVLDAQQFNQLAGLLQEIPLPEIRPSVTFKTRFATICQSAQMTLSKEIRPSEPIQVLLNDSLLQTWAREGIDFHRNLRSTCGFCGQTLPQDLWKKLDAHFNLESKELESEIKSLKQEIESEINNTSLIEFPERDSFYSIQRTQFNQVQEQFTETLGSYRIELEKILERVIQRERDLFNTKVFPIVKDMTVEINDLIGDMNGIIAENNKSTLNLSDRQREARDILRLNAVGEFTRQIDLNGEEKKISRQKQEEKVCNDSLTQLQAQLTELEHEIDTLRVKIQDEKMGADMVNQYLDHCFGPGGLNLVTIEDPVESKHRFQIMRGNETAYNMSEGECSIVSFCYFLARLEDIDTKGKELIVYIDDPVSSLDSNHIFFVYSLIENVIAKSEQDSDGQARNRYRQLFISTHSLEFLKYLKRLSKPVSTNDQTGYYLIEKNGSNSSMSLMPEYLRDYQTEFVYLFHQLYKCRHAIEDRTSHEAFYNFGNNLRKFLEAFLFYKFPYKEGRHSTQVRLHRFFGEDSTATTLTNRIMNELSHLEETLDRSMQPIDIPEITTVANFVLEKMYENDGDQYNALLRSIGEPTRTD